MGERDSKALEKTTREWMSSAGISLPVRKTLSMLHTLEYAYEDDFSVEKACDALDQLAGTAAKISVTLRQEYSDLQVNKEKN